jgi:membrane associated rhomboid family serine protease
MQQPPTSNDRPFRVCPACGGRTPSHLPVCIECGAASVQAMAEARERDDEQRFARTFFTRGTPATWALIGANAAVFVLMSLVAKSIDPGSPGYTVALANFGAKLNALIDQGQYWRFVTPAFIHIGVMHLGVNMYSLYAIGPQVERLYGTARFLILYLVSGVAGVAASYYMSPGKGLSAGASGALFGLLGVLLVFGLRYRSELPGIFRQAFHPRGLVPVLALNLFITFAVSFIDKWAHLGGLLAGGALAAVIPYFRTNERRASLVWRAVATLCVAATIACFVLAWRAPKLDYRQVVGLLAAASDDGDGMAPAAFVETYNEANEALDDVAAAMQRAHEQKATSPEAADRARAAAAAVRATRALDPTSKQLLEREARLLDDAAARVGDDPRSVTDDVYVAFVAEHDKIQRDWNAWIESEGPKFGLEKKDT